MAATLSISMLPSADTCLRYTGRQRGGPVEGGSANDYDYSEGDPVNQFDLDGRHCSGSRYRTGDHDHWYCKGARGVKAVARGARQGLDWTARCLSVLCIAKPLEVLAGLTAGYTLSGVAI